MEMSGDKVGSRKSEVGSGGSVGIFGGTFNPVHIGHLRTALELRQSLALQEMRLMPCAVPPHRNQPEVAAEHRLQMLRVAIDAEPGLSVDDRELSRPGPSYTIDSLQELRGELGDSASICLCIGMDSLVNLACWHRWRELLDYAHIVVTARPGWHAPEDGEVGDLVRARQSDSVMRLHQQPAGLVWLAEMTLLPVSSTDIRHSLIRGNSVRYLLPDKVIEYIGQYQLYSQ